MGEQISRSIWIVGIDLRCLLLRLRVGESIVVGRLGAKEGPGAESRALRWRLLLLLVVLAEIAKQAASRGRLRVRGSEQRSSRWLVGVVVPKETTAAEQAASLTCRLCARLLLVVLSVAEQGRARVASLSGAESACSARVTEQGCPSGLRRRRAEQAGAGTGRGLRSAETAKQSSACGV